MEIFDTAVIGGGAAGLIAATRLNGKTVIIEINDRVGKKLLASGNGRCNLSNYGVNSEKYNNPEFVLPVIQKFSAKDIVLYFNSLGLIVKEEENRIYPYSESAASVLDVLRNAIEKKQVKTVTDYKVTKITKTDKFNIFNNENCITARNIIFASGSRAGFGCESIELLADFGHMVIEPRPALTPIKCDTAFLKGLNGIRVRCKTALTVDGKEKASEFGEVLFKDYGLSGIAIFNLSLKYARLNCPENSKIILNLMPDFSLPDLINSFRERLKIFDNTDNFFTGIFHKCLSQNIFNMAKVNGKIEIRDIPKIAEAVLKYQVQIKSLCDFSLAQVSCGGLDIDSFDSITLESKLVPNLFAAGEALNIDGECGGYNLHWAWASGLTAADSVNSQK